MVVANSGKPLPDYDRESERKAFDDTKAGVKGLVDAGLAKVPRIFIHDYLEPEENSGSKYSQISIPVIDFKGIDEDAGLRAEVIDKIKDSCEKWGFFQIVDHGIPASVMDEMTEGVRRFYEQDTEEKKQYYSRDVTKKFAYFSNFALYQEPPADWRDTVKCVMAPHPPDPEELPAVCRDIMIEYSSYLMKLGIRLFELFSEALGLKPNHLKDLDCAKGLVVSCHYYPVCPEPELTLGASNHTDSGFFTVLLKDQTGGLQILHENRWFDVTSLPGALIINIADFLQLISNDKFKSVNHRVLANNKDVPRISTASLFRTHFQETSRVYGPLKELISEDNPPVYRDITFKEYLTHRFKTGLDGTHPLSAFKIQI